MPRRRTRAQTGEEAPPENHICVVSPTNLSTKWTHECPGRLLKEANASAPPERGVKEKRVRNVRA